MKAPVPRRVTLLALLLALSAGTARAADDQKPDRWYEAGMRHMKAREYRKAALAFDEAFQRDPSTVLLFNAARAHDRAGQLIAARERYRSFLARSDAPANLREWTVRRLRAVGAAIDKERSLAEKRDRERRLAELRKLLLREVRQELDEMTPAPEPRPLRFVDIRDLLPPSRPLRTAGWATFGVGLASLAVAVGLQVDAERIRSELSDVAPDPDTGLITAETRVSYFDRRDLADRENTAATVAFAVGGVMVATGITLLIVDAVRHRRRADGADGAPDVSVELRPDAVLLRATTRF